MSGNPAARPSLAGLAGVVLAFNIGVVLWGAVVRATGSGAGCGAHWPTCNGEVVPLAPSVATLIEFTHRATSGLALVLVTVLLARVLRSRAHGDLSRAWAKASMVLILSEAAIGAGLVLYKKVAEDTSLSRGLWISGHLVNTFLLLAALALTARFVDASRSLTRQGDSFLAATFADPGRRRALAIVLPLLVATGISGAIAALGDTLFKVETLRAAVAQDLSPTSHLFVRLRVFHPVLAIAGGFAALWLAYRSAIGTASSRGRTLARAIVGLVLAQWAIGIVNLLLLAPVFMQIVHLLVADLLWIMVLLFATESTAEDGVGDPGTASPLSSLAA